MSKPVDVYFYYTFDNMSKNTLIQNAFILTDVQVSDPTYHAHTDRRKMC